MLESCDWNSICPSRIIKEKYVFAFFIGYIDPQKHLIKQIGKKYNAEKIVYIKMDISNENFNELDNMEGLSAVGPAEFVALVRDAEAICTDSFHAFAFSIIFEKQFYLMNRVYTPLDEVSNQRWDNVMDKVGIERRYSNSKKEILALKDVDYDSVFQKIETLKNESREWLLSAITK